jgi:hypothetical protein
MTEPEIDTAIDRAARELMNVDADAAFRARVAERLTRATARRIRPWLLAVPATAVAIILALAWMRSRPDAPVGPGPLARLAAPAVAPAPQARAGLPPVSLPQRPAPAATRSSRRAATVPSARGAIITTAVEAPPDIPPLQALESITVEPIVHTSIAAAAIVIAPLPPIAEVQIEPLEPRAERQ